MTKLKSKMGTDSKKELVKTYYDQNASDYIQMYSKDYDELYPANAIRLEIMVKKLLECNTKSVFDAGCGTCGPMIRFMNEGIKCRGFDFSGEMVVHGQKELKKAGYKPDLIKVGDITNQKDFPDEKFDAVTAFGVFPHVENEKTALANLKYILNKNGKVFIEFRNDLFSLFTLNKYSLEFFISQLINQNSLPSNISGEVKQFFEDVFNSNKKIKKQEGKIHYTSILAKFKNPLTISKELFEPMGFHVDQLLFYHYHALPPIFDDKFPKEFREISLKMEDPYDWRGYFMASAFVVEATKIN